MCSECKKSMIFFSEQSGKLECISVIARIGPHVSICCRAESPASMDDLPLWRFEDHVDSYPAKDPALSFSGQKAIQVEEPDPQVDLDLGDFGPAFVGEKFDIPVTVTSKGHAIYGGELKINLVDARGGVLVSPREMEPMSPDDHHVELLGIAGPQGEEECQTGPDNIRKIQHSFGLVSVPFLNCGDSWTCKLETKWHRPKSVVVYVSLGYSSANSNESTSQKVHVHKSLQIEGKTAIAVSHRLMLPFRQDSLLLSSLKPLPPDADRLASLPLCEKSVLIVNARNCTEVPLQLISISIEADNNDGAGRSCTVLHGGEDTVTPTLLVPGEEFKKVFHVIPEVKSSKLGLGSVFLRWRRESDLKAQSCSNTEADGVLTKHGLPDVNVELSPLIVRLECPPHAILGVPFTFIVKIQNETRLLQEIKYTLGDSQSFVLSGSHNDTIFVLPRTEHSLSYMLVPLASGSQQLPRVTVNSVRYSAGFQPTIAASTIFVFPSKPHFDNVVDRGGDKAAALESIAFAA